MRMLAALVCLAAAPALAAEPDVAEGADLFARNCAICHGETGVGDGPMAEILTVKPADLTHLSVSNDGVFPTFRVIRQIDGRDPMLAHGGAMPLFGMLFDFPDSSIASETGQPIITAQPIVDIVGWLMTIQVEN